MEAWEEWGRGEEKGEEEGGDGGGGQTDVA